MKMVLAMGPMFDPWLLAGLAVVAILFFVGGYWRELKARRGRRGDGAAKSDTPGGES